MDEQWREFEKLVARIERAIGPMGAIIKSPDFVKDRVTGRLREVDASIRLQRDAEPIRVIECRDRAKIEDVMWIEQLATKCIDHGISTTAVSSSGFTVPAVIKANHYTIETRKISEISQEQMMGWIKINSITNIVLFQDVQSVELAFYGQSDEAGGMLHPRVVEEINKAPGKAAVFHVHGSDDALNIGEIVDLATRAGLDVHSGVPEDGSKVRKQAEIKFPKGLFWVHTASGPRDLAILNVGLDVHSQNTVCQVPNKGFSYSGTGRPAVNGVETSGEVLGNKLLFSFHKAVGSDVMSVTITRRKT